MKITPRIHQQLRVKNALITALLLCLLGSLAWLSNRYSVQTDMTNNAGNTLSQASQKLLASLPDKITITAYVKKGQPIRTQIAQLVDRYSRIKTDVVLNFIDPDFEPEKASELNIGPEGIILVEYQGRTEKLTFLDESSLTNALLQLANANERWVSFLTGHGERSPDGIANFDLGDFGKELARRKINTQTLNLATLPAIPDNAALLVIAAPKVPLLASEMTIIQRYIQRGGNLLVLTDPDNKQLTALQKQLGIKQLNGVIVDSSSTLYGVNDPSFILTSDYTQHPVTNGFKTLTLYPVVAALEIDGKTDFTTTPLLSSTEKSWTETGAIEGKIRFDANGQEKQGPLVFAYALTRTINQPIQQRIIVVGDGDFLANAYIGNVGNLDMGLRLVLWLIHEDRFIDIPAKTATDKTLQLTQTAVAVIGFGFLIILPLLLTVTGFIIWRKRKQR
ncbi:MAG: GldG family protein [Methylococcaceae bacterium]